MSENVVIQIGLPAALCIIMFSMGLGLTVGDFLTVFKRPRDFIIGAFLQLISLPAIAFLLASLWPVSPEIAVGIMLIAICPGGVTSNLLTHMARGDVALSIALTGVMSLASFITLPFILDFSLQHFLGSAAPELSIAKTVTVIFLLITLPTALGMLVKYFFPRFADSGARLSRPLVTVIFLLIVVGAIMADFENLPHYLRTAGPPIVAFNLIVFGVAALVAAWLATGQQQRIAITIECGLQNASLAITIALSTLQNPAVGIPAAVYGLFMMGTGLAVALLMKYRD